LTRLTAFSYVIGPVLALLLLWVPHRIAEHVNLPREGRYIIVICLLALTLVRSLIDRMQNRFWIAVITIILWIPATSLPTCSLAMVPAQVT